MTLSAGCAHYSAGLSPTDKPSPARAYLYGRFRVDAPSALLGMDSYQTMGFVMRCERRERVQASILARETGSWSSPRAPRDARWSAHIFTDADGVVKGSKRVLGRSPRSVRAGRPGITERLQGKLP